MNTLDAFGTEYLRISFGVERHFSGFIDAYVGPADLRAEANMAPAPTIAELLQRTRALNDQLPAQGYPASRRDYLDKQLTAMTMVQRKL